MRISRNLLQNPKKSHHQALKDLEDTETETLWFGFSLKNGRLNSCYQSYLPYYLLIFLIYQDILSRRGHLCCTRLDNFCYNTQNGLNQRLFQQFTVCNKHTQSPALFQNIFHFCTFLPKFVSMF